MAHWQQLVYSTTEAAHLSADLQAIKDEILGTGESDDEGDDEEEGSEDESSSEDEEQEQQKMQIQVCQIFVSFLAPLCCHLFFVCDCDRQHHCSACSAYSLQ